MKNVFLKITENRALTDSVWQMTLAGDCTGITKPGQFINIKLDGLYLRRPISVYDCGDGFVTVIYKVVGKGTELMSTLKEGKELDVICIYAYKDSESVRIGLDGSYSRAVQYFPDGTEKELAPDADGVTAVGTTSVIALIR